MDSPTEKFYCKPSEEDGVESPGKCVDYCGDFESKCPV